MKKIYILFITGILALSFCACGNSGAKMPESAAEQEPKIILADETPEESDLFEESASTDDNGLPEEGETARPEAMGNPEGVFSFADLKNLEFYFSSGAGGWATIMNIQADGSFSGQYSDSDMGMTGEGYPDGTLSQCDFTGQFTPPVKVNEYTYSTKISEINYAREAGSEEIKDGILYCYTDAYGLQDARDILIYLPDAPMSQLPEEFLSWVRYAVLDEEREKLSFYALNNEVNQFGFSSYNIVSSLKESIAASQEMASSLEDSIANDSLTQTEMNQKAGELYDIWDSELNHTWNVLKRTQDEETMRLLTEEEREWIALKEQAVSGLKEEYAGGTMLDLVVYQKAAEMTRDRVYELMELLD